MKERRLLQYNVYNPRGLPEKKNAGPKALRDAYQIFKRNGFEDFYMPHVCKAVNVARHFLAICRLKGEQLLLVQYPSGGRLQCLPQFKAAKKIALVHDLNAPREWKINGGGVLLDEIADLADFDCLISHNPRMTALLRENGLKTPVVELGIFDYLIEENLAASPERNMGEAAFAGNLSKAPFISQLAQVEGVKFLLYGERVEGLDAALAPGSVEWRGAFSTEEIPARIAGGWGLVWDGDSIDTCVGVFGEYLRINNPHKASLYIVAERPVIIWREAALASYILQKGLGIAVESLRELPARIAEVSDEAYSQMLANVREEKKRLVAGKNLEEAAEKALALVGD